MAEERLQELMKAADCLQIRGLSVPDDDLHNYSYNKRPLVLSGKEASNKRKKKSDDINVRYKTVSFDGYKTVSFVGYKL